MPLVGRPRVEQGSVGGSGGDAFVVSQPDEVVNIAHCGSGRPRLHPFISIQPSNASTSNRISAPC